ncbi:MAG: response regulator [Candidatus Abyssobacteria bacterium SURF_5]|uniref:Response regulator n=1 Tax=Abyssobacteria bacterium (strain SURF_5) TaxID=2093360 RepID=A0A3A4NA94_ABYX5|nr:MAG: response regulator [Candidatus Abyssubacteria bacterium SURF_5]
MMTHGKRRGMPVSAKGEKVRIMEAAHSVLLVDDDRKFREAMKKTFQNAGYAVTSANDAQKALDLLSEDAFDLIISEVKTPSLDGMELMREIVRKRIKVSVIFVTAYGEVESYLDLMNMGAFEYLHKPVNEPEILHLAKSAVERSGISRMDTHGSIKGAATSS